MKADAAACGAMLGALFGGFSLAFVGNFAFALDADEEKTLGQDFADCLETLPPVIAETVGKGGPWLRLASHGGSVVMKRMAIYNQARMQAVAQKQAEKIVREAEKSAPTIVTAPEPKADHQAPIGPNEIFAPNPAA